MKKTIFYPSFMVKISLLLLCIFYTNAFAKPPEPNFNPNSGDTCESKGTDDVSFGVISIDKLPGWCSFLQGCPSSCEYEAADDFYKTSPLAPNTLYSLKKLVTEPYNKSDPNIKNYWMECGFGTNNFCVDDDVSTMIDKSGECLVFEKVPVACTVTFWVQLVSECDNCIKVDGTTTLGGTWWKWQKTLAPDQMPGTCNNSYLKSHIKLELQELRTKCNDENTQWGCGAKEVRD